MTDGAASGDHSRSFGSAFIPFASSSSASSPSLTDIAECSNCVEGGEIHASPPAARLRCLVCGGSLADNDRAVCCCVYLENSKHTSMRTHAHMQRAAWLCVSLTGQMCLKCRSIFGQSRVCLQGLVFAAPKDPSWCKCFPPPLELTFAGAFKY